MAALHLIYSEDYNGPRMPICRNGAGFNGQYPRNPAFGEVVTACISGGDRHLNGTGTTSDGIRWARRAILDCPSNPRGELSNAGHVMSYGSTETAASLPGSKARRGRQERERRQTRALISETGIGWTDGGNGATVLDVDTCGRRQQGGPMDTISKLQTGDPWECAMALQSLTPVDLARPEILAAVLALLKDWRRPGAASAQLAPAERDLARRFGIDADGDGLQSIDWNPECAVEGPDLQSLSDLVKEVLNSADLTGDDVVLQALIDVTGKPDDRGLVFPSDWIDENFHRFPWPDPSAAFRRLAAAVLQTQVPHFGRILESVTDADLQWLVTAVIATGYAGVVLRSLAEHAGPRGRRAVLAGLEAAPQDRPALVPAVYFAGTDPELRPRAVALLKTLARTGCPYARVYLAIFVPESRTTCGAWLDDEDEKEVTHFDDLLDILRSHPAIADYPLPQLFAWTTVPRSLELLDAWQSALAPETIRAALEALAEHARMDWDAYPPLLRLARNGWLTEPGERVDRFWRIIRSALQASKTGNLDWLGTPLSGIYAGFDHPLIALGRSGRPPPAFRREILQFAADGLLSAPLILEILPDFPQAGHETDLFRRLAAAELERVAQAWAEEQDERRRQPEDHWYDDRKAPTSVLQDLGEYWRKLRETAHRVGGMQALIVRLDKLSTLDWSKRLRDLSAPDPHP